jgi:CheY-like chemotaxis protein
MPLKKAAVDLRMTARRTVASLGGAADECRLELELPGAATVVEGDPYILQRVIGNLLSNAIKFSPVGGVVRLTVEDVDGSVRLAVHDQGPGVPEEYQERIFEKFGQVESRRENRKYSTGLGLTFVKMAVEAHGGTVGLESGPGDGSRFWFSLPGYDESVNEPSAAEQAEVTRGDMMTGQRRILVVDDDPGIRQTFRGFLESAGHRVEASEDGAIALKRLQAERFDLVISDVVMPEKEGMELLMDLRREFEDLPVIIVSGGIPGSSMDVHHTARLLGARETLKKPVTSAQLLTAVARAFD